MQDTTSTNDQIGNCIRIEAISEGTYKLSNSVQPIVVLTQSAQQRDYAEYLRIMDDGSSYLVFVSHLVDRLPDMSECFRVKDDHLLSSVFLAPAKAEGKFKLYNLLSPGIPALRMSPKEGVLRSAMWNYEGNKVAYMCRHQSAGRWTIVVLDLRQGRESTYDGLDMCEYNPNISWSKSGNYIAFVGAKRSVCLLDLSQNVVRQVLEGEVLPGIACDLSLG
jgi:hypothetical protein